MLRVSASRPTRNVFKQPCYRRQGPEHAVDLVTSQVASLGLRPPKFRLTLLLERLHSLAVIGRADGHRLVRNARIHDRRCYSLELEIDEYLRPANGVA